MPDRKPYTHVRLILDETRIPRYEIRVSTFVEFDENAGRRAVTGKPTRKQAEVIAKENGWDGIKAVIIRDYAGIAYTRDWRSVAFVSNGETK